MIRVAAGGGDDDLPGDLVDAQLQSLLDGRLPGAGERVPERLLDPRQVDDPGARPAVAGPHRVAVGARIEVEAELVHQRQRPAARPVCGAEVAEEADGRGRGVRRCQRQVVAAAREAEADHADRRVDRLQRVVGAGEQVCILGGRKPLPGTRELRALEARLVRLVADDVLPHLRVFGRELGQEGSEALGGVRCGQRRRADGKDVEDDADALRLGHRQGAVEEGLLEDRLGALRIPVDRDPVLGAAGGLEVREEGGAAVVRVLARVVGEAEASGLRG